MSREAVKNGYVRKTLVLLEECSVHRVSNMLRLLVVVVMKVREFLGLQFERRR